MGRQKFEDAAVGTEGLDGRGDGAVVDGEVLSYLLSVVAVDVVLVEDRNSFVGQQEFQGFSLDIVIEPLEARLKITLCGQVLA